MRKRALIILPAAVFCLAVVFIVLSRPRYEPVSGQDIDINKWSEEAAIELLLSGGRSDKGGWEEALAELSVRKDGIGYAALLAQAELVQSRGGDAEEYLRGALRLHSSRDVRWWLAVLLTDKQDVPAARAEFTMLLPDLRAIEELLRLKTDPAVVLDALAEGGHWQVILDVLGEGGIISGEDAAAGSFRFYKAQALAMLGHNRQAMPLLAELTAQGYDDQVILRLYAGSLEAAGYAKKAAEIYKQLGPAGARRLGRLYELSGKKPMAAAAYENSPEPAALWRSAILWEELGDSERALTVYLRLSEIPGPHQDDALFRSNRLLSRSDTEKAAEILTRLKDHPAWMNRLGLTPDWPDLESVVIEETEILERLNLYKSFARPDLLRAELDIARHHATPEEKIAIGRWHRQNSDYREAVRWGSRALADLKVKEAYELAYPRPFREIVERAAAEFELDTMLIWAVMREESLFQPQAVSRVGALGLMQIMPATGKEIARGLRDEFNAQRLLDPGTNIRHGAYYLRRLLDRFDGDPEMALAAYNGGSGNVNIWRYSKLGMQAGGFPTAVTFFETREYITKVMNSYLRYRWLYNN